MRRYIKRQILQVLQTLKQVNAIIEAFCKNGADAAGETQRSAQMANILEECQNAAIAAGAMIERAEGEDTDAVRALERYCEALYRCAVGERKAADELVGCLCQCEEGLDKFPETEEIVFLPYKASMWDSLESVWRAADENKMCDAYVIPIPYFDKKPDGTVSEMHYEGAEFPEDVPITDWQQYSLEERHPDKIYIHNPYDQYNNVTTVHPKFYSTELKKYTDELIYIPYFVCWDDVEEHFCTTMGVFNADKVILQSEKVADTYKRVYIETLGAEQKALEERTGQRNEEFWRNLKQQADEKFLPLGSPKCDKVRSTTREQAEAELPEEWKNKIYDTDKDGRKSRRKVLLYNTSVQALLDHREQAVKKIKSVLETLKGHQEIVLWWRPHPLNSSTLDAMLPAVEKEYLAVIETYRRENWGIYDDTANLNRAIAVSDAYYGDGGSIPALFRETEKPIMFQNYEILT